MVKRVDCKVVETRLMRPLVFEGRGRVEPRENIYDELPCGPSDDTSGPSGRFKVYSQGKPLPRGIVVDFYN